VADPSTDGLLSGQVMFIVYVIESQANGKIYIGQTGNLERRLKRHNQELPTKKSSYTRKNKGPWKVIYIEEFKTRSDAIKREKQLKTSRGRRFLKKFRRS
jgi:putative endonuclease